MKDLLGDYSVAIELPVIWGDMDAFLHVNNTVYFRYFENVRIKYLEAINYLEHMEKTALGPILSSTQCRYRLPLTYPDTVTVGTRLKSLEDDRFTMEYVVVSHQHAKIAAEGEGVIVSFDYNSRQKAPIPEQIRVRMLELAKGVSGEKTL